MRQSQQPCYKLGSVSQHHGDQRQEDQWVATSLSENLEIQVRILPQRIKVTGKKGGHPMPSNIHTPNHPHLISPSLLQEATTGT